MTVAEQSTGQQMLVGLARPLHTTETRLKGMLPLPMAIYLIAILLPITFRLGPLYMTSVRLVVLVLVLPLAIRLLMGHFGRILLIDILFFLHIAWAAVALAVNNPDMVVTQIGSLGPEFLGGYLIGRAYIRSREQFVALCRWAMMVVLVTLPFALYETRTGYPPIIGTLQKLPGFGSFSIVNYEGRLGLQRVQAMTTHPIHYGLFASTALSLTLVGLKGVMSDTRRYLAGAGVALCTFLSLSSGALLPMIMQFFLIGWGITFRRTGMPWLLLALLAGAAYLTVDLLSNRSPIQVFFSYATFSAHNAYWRGLIFEWGMKNVWDNPVFGIGLNDWVRPHFMHTGSMDNFWLVMAVRYGFPGFLLVALPYLWGLWRVGRREFSADPELARLRRAWMFTFVSLTFTLCTVHVWTSIYSFVFMVYGAGMWFISATPRQADPAPEPDRRPVTGLPRPAAGLGVLAGQAADMADSAGTNASRYTRFPLRTRQT